MKLLDRFKNNHEMRSLRKRLLLFMLLCWVIPIAVFFAFTTISYRDSIMMKTEKLIEDEMENISSYAAIRIDDAISLCQKPSYEKVWENAWGNYKDGLVGRSEYLQSVNSSLKGKFYLDERFNTYAFYIYGENNPGRYSSRVGTSYNYYIENIQKEVREVMKLDSSYAYVKVIDGKLYIIRNLYTTDRYERYGTLAVELNKDKVFKELSYDMQDNIEVVINDTESAISFNTEEPTEGLATLLDCIMENYDNTTYSRIDKTHNDAYNAYLYQKKYNNYHIGVTYWANRAEIYSSLYETYFIEMMMLCMFIPLIYYGVHFLKKQIQNPISQLMKAAKKMEAGMIGTKVSGEPMPNSEFGYLKDSFDSMSAQVKCLFDYAYDEKLARKDAQIQALQAQINPHFLNNTLEMMNWQARMSGDAVVSKMIEALGTVLNYRMNRANVKEIHLAEELQCTDAYLYIMSMRFGQRLQIEKEIDEDLLYISVPPLILQPIAENAIVHGVETVTNGLIRLKVYHDEHKVYFEVMNTGKPLTDENMERISKILNGNDEDLPKYQGRHTSIGIRNVNKRVKLVYGEKYGLTIEPGEGDVTISTITIPYMETKEEKLDEELDNMEMELRQLLKTRNDKWQE